MSEFNSPIFGPTRTPTEAEAADLTRMAAEIPVALFAALSKMMNERGLLLGIHSRDELQ